MACAAYLASIAHMQVRKLWQWSCARASRSIKPAHAHYEFYISAIFQILLWQDHAPLIPKLPTWDATQAEALLKQAEAHGDNDSLPELQTKLPLANKLLCACTHVCVQWIVLSILDFGWGLIQGERLPKQKPNRLLRRQAKGVGVGVGVAGPIVCVCGCVCV